MKERVLAARWILPITRPPLRDAHVRLRGSQVVAISPGRPADAIDLGDVALVPGLVNAHCHLEFSHLSEPLGTPAVPLDRWIVDVVRHRTAIASEDPKASIAGGLEEVAASGTRLVCDIASTDWSRAIAWPAGFPIDAFLMPEVIGLSVERATQRFDAACRTVDAPPPRGIAWGVSPHAPYSTLPEMIERAVQMARVQNIPLAMHVAESEAEEELTCSGRGPFAAALQELGAWREGVFPTGIDQRQLMELLCRAPRTLIVHGNYLSDATIEFVAAHPHATVVYCARTHAFFGHPPHPIDRLLAAGVRVALGTDSRASNPDLSLWHDVQYLWRHRPDLDPQAVLRCATLAGADALGRTDLGRIAAGAQPGLLSVPTTATIADQLFRDLAGAVAPPQWVA